MNTPAGFRRGYDPEDATGSLDYDPAELYVWLLPGEERLAGWDAARRQARPVPPSAPAPSTEPRSAQGPAKPRQKKLIHGTWRIQVELSGDAQPVLGLLWAKWQPARGQSFVVTHGSANGTVLDLQVEYTARGANATDVRRRVERAIEGRSLHVVGEMNIRKLPTAGTRLARHS